MEAYRYQDEKSDKFWRIEYEGAALAVNYGKTGTTGRYQVKEFGDEGECEKEAKKLAASKVKKGYLPYPEFDPLKQLYFDDEELGPHPLTSHPNFRRGFDDELYYSCIDEEAPFGSDEGSDTLYWVAEGLRNVKALDFAAFPKKAVEEYCGMSYIPPGDISRDAVERLLKEDEMALTQSDMTTYAVAFAQIKITGRLDAGLKEAAIGSMRRIAAVADIMGWGPPSEIGERMVADLERFPAD